jgi:hypothetical protein
MPTITHDPTRQCREIAYPRAEVEDLIWRDCEARGYRVRPEDLNYYGGRPERVGVEVPETDGPRPRLATPLKKGARIYRNVYAGSDGRGCDQYDPQPLTIVRVNRKTVTADTDQGIRTRVPLQDIQGAWLYDD